MSKTQSDFFYLIGGERKKIGRVIATRFNGFRAELAGGWWVAYGDTEESAIKAAIKRYNDEADRFGWEQIEWVK